MPRLTKTVVESAAPQSDRDVFIWDTDLKGFGLRVKPSGVKTYLVQYRNKSGQSKRVSIGQHGVLTTEEARGKARTELAKVTLGADPKAERDEQRRAWTVRQLADHYMRGIDTGDILTRFGRPKSASTIATDRGRIDRHILPLIGNKPVRDLIRQDVLAAFRDIKAGRTAVDVVTEKLRGRAIVEGGRGTAKRTIGLLSGMLREAVNMGLIATNPAHGLALGKDKRREENDPETLYQALGRAIRLAEGELETRQATECLRFIALTGFRLGEAIGLRWSEIDVKRRVFRLVATKTGASVRPMSRSVSELLARVKLGAGESEYVFPAKRSSEGHYGGMPTAVARIVGAGALSGADRKRLAAFTPHRLRHAAATTGDSLGLTLPTIGALLGHTTGGTTAGYVGRVDAVLIAATDRLADTIALAMGEAESGEVIDFTTRTANR